MLLEKSGLKGPGTPTVVTGLVWFTDESRMT